MISTPLIVLFSIFLVSIFFIYASIYIYIQNYLYMKNGSISTVKGNMSILVGTNHLHDDLIGDMLVNLYTHGTTTINKNEVVIKKNRSYCFGLEILPYNLVLLENHVAFTIDEFGIDYYPDDVFNSLIVKTKYNKEVIENITLRVSNFKQVIDTINDYLGFYTEKYLTIKLVLIGRNKKNAIKDYTTICYMPIETKPFIDKEDFELLVKITDLDIGKKSIPKLVVSHKTNSYT